MKRVISLLLALALFGALWGCGGGKQPEVSDDEPAQPGVPVLPEEPETPAEPEEPGEDAPVVEPGTAEAPVQVTARESSAGVCDADGQTVLLNIDASFPEIEEMERVTDYYRAMQADLETVYGADAEEAAARREELLSVGSEFSPWQVTMEYEVLRNDGVTLSILRRTYENRGGAYPTVTLRGETFDVASQGLLLLGDLFTVGQAEAVGAVMAQVWAQMEAQSDTVWLVSAEEQLEQMYDPLDFTLTDDSLVVFFGDSQLAAHAAGEQRFDLPLAELSHLLRPEYVTE